MNDTYLRLKGYRDKTLKDILMNLIAFLFPFLVVAVAFVINGVFPFGKRMILTVDCYHQYVPFLVEFRNKFWSGGSLFYSWNNGLGMEYYPAFANYCSSPLNIFALFFTAKTMPVFAALVTCVRAGLASLFMSFFLTSEDYGRRDFVTLAFSAAYALCGWFCTDFWNLMWCDALVLLPLILYGLRLLFVERKYALYIASLALCIISNYYTGFFVCIFLLLFAPIYYFTVFQSKKEPEVEGRLGAKTFFTCAVRFVVGSLLAGAISAVITLPTYLILQTTSAVGSDFPTDYKLTGNLFDFIGRFLVAANPNIRDGMANVYSGIIPAVLLPLFFALDKKTGINLRHKLTYGFMLLFMYVSFSNRILDFIWHGFHFPNQIPYRESFLMSFLVITVGFKTIRNLKSFSLGQITAAFVGAGVFLILFEKLGTGKEGYIQVLVSVLFIILEGILLTSIKKGKRKNPKSYEGLLAGVMAAEMLASSIITISLVDNHEGFPQYKTFGMNYVDVAEAVNSLEGTAGHMLFERSELYPNNICDIQSVYDVKGLSVFSSTTRESFIKYIRNFGFHNNGINSVRNAGMTRVTASLLGVRNMVAIEDTNSRPLNYPVETTNGDVTVYANYDALSVGYMVSPDLANYMPSFDDYDVFQKTNEWVNSMGVEGDVYNRIDVEPIVITNLQETRNSFGYYAYSVSDTSRKCSITFRVENATIGSEVYIFPYSSKGGTLSITYLSPDGNADNNEVYNNITLRSYQIISLGNFDGRTIEATITYSTPPSGALNIYTYELNLPVYENMIDTLSANEAEVTYYDDTTIECSVDASEDGLCFFTIPYTDGFEAEVDGVPTEITSIQDAFIGIMLSEGHHEIKLKYTVPCFSLGALISITALLCSVLLCVVMRIVNKRLLKENVSSVSDSETSELETVAEQAGMNVPSEESVETLIDTGELSSEEEISSETEENTENTDDSSDDTGSTGDEEN